jgi:hypothetical protein
MFTQERTYSLFMLAALAAAVVVTFVALVHGFGEVKMLW